MSAVRKPGFVAVNVFTVLLFALLLWLMLAFIDSQRAVKLQTALEAESTSLSNAISETLHTSVEGLRAVASLLVAFEDVDYETFSRFARRYVEADGGLLVLEWQPRVLREDRSEFVRGVRERGLPDFRLWEPDADGNPVEAAERAVHVPVLYMLSRHPGTDTTGLDLAWSPLRMESKWTARDSGQPQSSGFFRIVTGVDGSYAPVGLAITLPIYRGGVIPGTATERKSQLLGYLAGVFAVEELVAPQIQMLAERGFNVVITDPSDSGIAISHSAGLATAHVFNSEMTLFGNDWLLRLTATRTGAAQGDDPLWLLLPIATVVLGLLVLLALYLFENKNLALEAAKQELSSALARARKSEAYLRELSRRDQLTGLFNRRALFDQIERELKRGARHGFASTLLMLDLDFFKQINDRYGHPAGDEVLKQFSAFCLDTARSTDVVARMGGEEFALLLPQTDRDEALAIAERLRERVEQRALDIDGVSEPVRLTVSIGLAATNPEITRDQLISLADAAMYDAKQAGRNCVRSAE